MNNQVATKPDGVLSSLVLKGDISGMTEEQKVSYYKQFCDSLGLNPLTQPFKILKLQGREMLYATKDATEQLRKIHGISITEITSEEIRGVFIVTAKAKDSKGKADASTGAVNIQGLSGEALANAFMKAETKAKRRVTLSICGMGTLDETEIETVDAQYTDQGNITTGSKLKPYPDAPKPIQKQTMTDAAFKKAIDRILAGEVSIVDKLATYELSESQSKLLQQTLHGEPAESGLAQENLKAFQEAGGPKP
ncbi:MAG TPA: hypothetical protein VGZ90_13490 [Puia sp.]|jgi:hypothetical protein|nr:hypothetical protein [Puia sp.]